MTAGANQIIALVWAVSESVTQSIRKYINGEAGKPIKESISGEADESFDAWANWPINQELNQPTAQ